MKLIKGKRQYKLPPYRKVIQVAVIIKFPKHTWDASLAPKNSLATFNPGHVGTPYFYALGPDQELFIWPTPEKNGRLKVTLAVDQVI